jgi:hypothetical protein
MIILQLFKLLASFAKVNYWLRDIALYSSFPNPHKSTKIQPAFHWSRIPRDPFCPWHAPTAF